MEMKAWVCQADSSYEVDDPTTEETLTAVPDMTRAEADSVIGRTAAVAAEWRQTSFAERARVLRCAADVLDSREDELVAIAIRDTGARAEIARSTHVRASITRLREWSSTPEAVLRLPHPDDENSLRSRVTRAPLGVVGCISPYNFPLLSMVGKAAPALLAGNAIVMKPAPQDPLLVNELASALAAGLESIGQSPDVASLVLGASPDLGAAVVAHPEVRAISFTGSTAVGKSISIAAAPSLKQLLLELGGKGALIARADADPARVVQEALRTFTVQAGQVCLTPSRIIADESIHDAVVSELCAAMSQLEIGDPARPQTTVGPVISGLQRDRVRALVASAEDEGGTVHRFGSLPGRGYFVEPTLITGCSSSSAVMQEEVFGPVISVVESSSDKEATHIANDTRYGLYDYIFSADVGRSRDIASQLESAQVSINSTRRNYDAPFGGNKDSGYGRSGGLYALDAYTTIQTLTELYSD